jgi:hypothetical protein
LNYRAQLSVFVVILIKYKCAQLSILFNPFLETLDCFFWTVSYLLFSSSRGLPFERTKCLLVCRRAVLWFYTFLTIVSIYFFKYIFYCSWF